MHASHTSAPENRFSGSTHLQKSKQILSKKRIRKYVFKKLGNAFSKKKLPFNTKSHIFYRHNTLQHTQHTATHCNTLQRKILTYVLSNSYFLWALQAATHCNPLQHKKPYICSVGRNTLLSSDFELNKRPRILIFLNTQWM